MCDCSSHNGFLTAKGLRETEQRSLEGLDAREVCVHLDKVGSVSALAEAEDLYALTTDQLLLEQSERFHNGS